MKTGLLVAGALLLLSVCSAIAYNSLRNIDNFKCVSQSRYRIARDDNAWTDFFVTQNLQLYADHTGFISFVGHAVNNGVDYKINRKVKLKDGFMIDDHTFHYTIEAVRKVGADNLPVSEFQTLLMEVSGDEAVFLFERERIDENAWILGNPNNWFMTCAEY